MIPTLKSLPPVLPENPCLLILGSMPSQASLLAGAYYAHPRNAFWPIMLALTGTPPTVVDYQERLCALRKAGIALWDVLGCCQRKGSLDSAIIPESEHANNIASLLQTHRSIAAIALNGRKAQQCFHRHINGISTPPDLIPLPSTSPANARLSLSQKQAVWVKALAPYLRRRRNGGPGGIRTPNQTVMSGLL